MVVTKLKIAAAVLAIVGVIGTGVAVSAYYSPAAKQEAANKSDDTPRASKDDPPNQARPEQEPKERKRADSTPRKVQVMRPISRQVVDHQDFTGRTEATKAEVFAQTSGELQKVVFQPGAEVKKGDLLFQIDPRAYQAELDKAEAEYARAQGRLERATAQLERAKKLKANNAINEEDFDRIAGDREDAKTTLQAAKASRELARLHLESTAVTAPISGQTGRAPVTPGSVVKAGTTLLTTIVALDSMHVEFDIGENTFLRLQRGVRGQKIKLLGASVSVGLSDEDGLPHRGTIDFVGNQFREAAGLGGLGGGGLVGGGTGTLPVRVSLPNKDRILLPGLFVRGRVAISEPRAALLVPEDAVVEPEDERAFLFVVTNRKAVERRAVKLGAAEEDGLREIKEGLAAGDWVVIQGLKDLQPGMAVEPERVSLPKRNKD